MAALTRRTGALVGKRARSFVDLPDPCAGRIERTPRNSLAPSRIHTTARYRTRSARMQRVRVRITRLRSADHGIGHDEARSSTRIGIFEAAAVAALERHAREIGEIDGARAGKFCGGRRCRNERASRRSGANACRVGRQHETLVPNICGAMRSMTSALDHRLAHHRQAHARDARPPWLLFG